MRRMPGRASTGMRRSSPTGGRRTCWRRDSGRPACSAAHSCGSTARSLSSTGYPVQVASCARCRHHRPMRGVSIELLPDPPAAEVLSATCAADELGLHTAFLADEIYHRDAWMILAAAAQRTTRIRLAPGVAHVTLRDPLLAAQQLATLDELTGGRGCVLGGQPRDAGTVRLRPRGAACRASTPRGPHGHAVVAGLGPGGDGRDVSPLPRGVHECARRVR